MKSALLPQSKLPDVGTTIFTVIGQLSAEHNALNLSQGAPNFSCQPSLIDSVTKAMREGHNQYAPMSGVAALRHALSAKVDALYGCHYDADAEVTVMARASEGLYSAISALVHPGDEVIYFEPRLTATRRLSACRARSQWRSRCRWMISASTGIRWRAPLT